MTCPLRPLRKSWREDRRWYARLRALYLIVVKRHETEICCRCGGPVGSVFHLPDPLWWRINGQDDGVLCIGCVESIARDQEIYLCWEATEDEWPSCSGSPCPHEETMLIQRAELDRLDAQREETGSRPEDARHPKASRARSHRERVAWLGSLERRCKHCNRPRWLMLQKSCRPGLLHCFPERSRDRGEKT